LDRAAAVGLGATAVTVGAAWGSGGGGGWRPPGYHAEPIRRLNKETNAALVDPKMKARLLDLGGTPMPMRPADFGRLIADDTDKWGKVIKFAGIKAD